jgi:fluoride exporter
MKALAVALGGAAGALSRYGVMLLVARYWRRDFPLATFLINITGSFIVGFFATIAAEKTPIDPFWRLLIVTGFVGAYTTFSTFEYETQRLAQAGAIGLAVTNVVGSVVAGFIAVQLGVVLARQ